jgi:FkbM family methyltransferase
MGQSLIQTGLGGRGDVSGPGSGIVFRSMLMQHCLDRTLQKYNSNGTCLQSTGYLNMHLWAKRRAKIALDYIATKVSDNLQRRTADIVRDEIRNGIRSEQQSEPRPRATPLVIDEATTHFYIHTSDGHRFFLDAKDLHISLHVLEHGHWEDHVRDVMMQILKPGSTFVDVGGNVGLHTIFAASIVGATGKVFAFEPLPHMFKTLKLNIDINGMGGIVTPFQMAVSDVEETKTFSNFKSHSAMSGFTVPQIRLETFNETEEQSVEVIEVLTTTLDQKFANQRVHGLKIDVEGYESLVIRGAHEVIKNNADIGLIVEWDPHLIEKTLGSDSMAETIAFFQSERFTPYFALWRQPLKRVSWEETPSLRGDLVLSRDAALR